ncbi:hypothetical protein RB195_005966 [Necator americanus]|uniref:Transcription factor 25 n=1 Tax=Necator americanus TaxID=51031 RepID=A0ABR1BTT0_NECAM
MSTKHLRRMMDEKEKEQQGTSKELDEDVPCSRISGPVNRFAAFVDDDGFAEKSATSDEEGEVIHAEGVKPAKQDVSHANLKNKRKTNKKKKKQKKAEVEEPDEDQLLERLALENQSLVSSTEDEPIGVADVLKPDPRLYDAAAELKKALGKAFKDSAPVSSRSHRKFHAAGKFVKQKYNWPPVRSIGLSMELDREEGEVKWFKFVHNAYYEKLERVCWVAEDSFDPSIIEQILVENPYHLNSLLLLANVFRMQEDTTQSCDVIERGIFYCEQSMSCTFQPSSFYHRIDYLDYENRAFYLLLHRNMLNCVQRRCFETALNFAKLILTMDPQRDPLAVLLLIDTIAIKAKQYKWLKDFYRCCKDWKNLDMLPNFCYSMALAQFLDSKTDEDLITADEMLSHAICAFPGVVTFLLDKMQVEPDATVETHRHLGTFAANKETDGLKLVFKMFVNEAVELWKSPEALSWLETITRDCALSKECEMEMDNWKEKRQRVFVGAPPNIRRLAVLLGLESSPSSVTDPVPPVNGRNRYVRELPRVHRPDSFLSGFLHSILPEFDSGEHLTDALQRLRDQLQRYISSSSPATTNATDDPLQDDEPGP